MKKAKPLTKLEKDIFRVVINSNPRRSPVGQLEEIMRLIKVLGTHEEITQLM